VRNKVGVLADFSFKVLGGNLIERTGGNLGGGNAQRFGLLENLLVLETQLL
jgi:hypothetical protein